MKTKILRSKTVERLTVGEITICRLPNRPRKLWLTNAEGEGMETPEKKLAEELKRYFNREF